MRCDAMRFDILKAHAHAIRIRSGSTNETRANGPGERALYRIREEVDHVCKINSLELFT